MDAPDAFEMTVEQEEQAPAEHWVEWARRGASARTSATFVAVHSGEFCGMAGGFLRRDAGRMHATLFGVWVEPARREAGVGRDLVQAVTEWARGRGAQQLQLWVTEGNLAARSLYRRMGFTEAGESKPLASNPGSRETLMILQLQ